MGFLTKTWEIIKTTCHSILDALMGRRDEWQDKLDELEHQEESTLEQEGDPFDSGGTDMPDGSEYSDEKVTEELKSDVYQINSVDIELRDKCIEYIKQKFPNGFTYYYENSTVDERLQLLRTMTYELAEIYEVKLYEVDLYTTDGNSPGRCLGCYSPNQNTVRINIHFLFLDNIKWTKEAFLTIFHELKHARQWHAVNDWHNYGYNPGLVYAWAINFNNYSDGDDCYEDYRKQPIESDAFGFSEKFEYYFDA